jgi:VWFA-related protein
MKKCFISLVLTLFFTLVSFGQESKPTPPAGEDVVKISTNLIQIDVTVTDKNGKTAPGLSRDDFEIYENGEKQDISNFLFVSNLVKEATLSSDGQTVTGGVQTLPVGPAGPLGPSQVRRTIAVVIDDLNLSYESIYHTRAAIRKFVSEQMEPGDLVAIIRTSGGVGALQQFTSDKRMLLAAVEKIRWNPLGTAGVEAIATVQMDGEDITEYTALDNGLGSAAVRPEMTARISGRKRPSLTTEKTSLYHKSRGHEETQEGINTLNSLGAIRYIIEGMGELPGRKAMMLFSDGIRISGSGNGRADTVKAFLEQVAESANRASVVVYTFDTKGLRPMGFQASDNLVESHEDKRNEKSAERLINTQGSQEGLTYFAGQTGGKALINSNDLSGGIERVLGEQSGYYLLAYQPDADSFDPSKRRFNKLEVKIKRPDLKASYRSEFFSSAGSNTAAGPMVSTEQKMAKALTSPFAAKDIALNINALYADDPTDGAYIRAFVHIDAQNLKFSDDAEGWKKAAFDIAAVTFGDNGLPVEKKETTYTIKTKGATYNAMLENGFVYVLIMPVKQAGTYQYRVALRDADTGRIGSASQILEIPDLSKNKLTVSSLAVENVSMATWQNITQGKVGSAPGQMQVVSTLLYDTVLKQFRPGSVLRYGFEVYNAKIEGPRAAQIETQAKILQNNRVVVEGNLTKVNTADQTDQRHLRVSGNMMLKDTLPAGDYVLQVIVRDAGSKQTSTQLFPFEIVK